MYENPLACWRCSYTIFPQVLKEESMKIVLRGMGVAVMAAVCVTGLMAQDKSASADAKAAAPTMPMPKPDPEMTRLIKMMSGNWTVIEKSQPSPMMPNGGSGQGSAVMTAGPGGMSLMEKYHSSGLMGSNFNGFGTFWWDPKAQVYRGLWCDTMTPGGCDASGTTKWDGDKLVGTMEGDMNGQKVVTRFIYSDWKPNSFMMTMEMGPDVNSMKEAMTISYTRSSSAAKSAQ
jgi:hypothetical protein